MNFKVKELRNRGDETARIILAHQMEGLEPPPHRRDFQYLLELVSFSVCKPLLTRVALFFLQC